MLSCCYRRTEAEQKRCLVVWAMVAAGVVAGVPLGYVLQRGQVCFHAAFRGLYAGRTALWKAWAMAVAVTMLGLTAVYELGPWDQLSQGLGFRPVAAVVGGVTFGIGMAVAASCVSGLFFKLGAGMLGASVGLVGWGTGEVLVARSGLAQAVSGPQVLAGGIDGTIPGLLEVPRAAVAVPVAVVAIVLLLRTTRGAHGHPWQWRWPLAGASLGAAAVFSWATAGMSGAGFGASTSGAVISVADGSPAWWRVAFLLAIVVGAAIAARSAGGWWLRGEPRVRYLQLASGGLAMGAGARVAGGCNLGHGLSGVAQLNVSSLVVVAAMVAGVGLARAVQQRLGGARADRDQALATLGDHEVQPDERRRR